LAINITDGKLYYKDSGGTVQVLATKGGVGSSTTTQVLYNSSGLVVGSANMVFDGSTLTTLNSAYTGTLTGGTGIVNLGSGQFYKDANGNVGIGTIPSTWNSNYSKSIQVGTQGAYIAGNTASYSGGTYAWFGNNGYLDSSAVFRYTASTSACQYSQIANQHIWSYAASGTAGNAIAFTEAMRIDSSGNLLVGTTSVPTVSSVSGNNFNVSNTANNGAWSVFQSTGATNNRGIAISYPNAAPNNAFNEFIFCRDSTNTRFAVLSNGGIDNFSGNNTNLSDERTKTNIELSSNYLNKICAIPVKLFNYKDETEGEQKTLGVVAQDVEAVAPEFVSNNSRLNDMPKDGVPLKSIYTTDMMFGMMKAIQELNAKVDAQAVEIATLKAK
jgi:hypothetical protein